MAGRGDGALFAVDLTGSMLKAFELFQDGKASEAAELAEKIYEGSLTYYGPAHAQVISALDNLVTYCQAAGQNEKAAAYAALGYEKSLSAFGADDARTLKFKALLPSQP